MKVVLMRCPKTRRQLAVDLVHRLEQRPAELHASLDHARPVLADDPLRRLRDEVRCGLGRGRRERERIEPEPDLSVRGAGQLVQGAHMRDVGER